MTQNTRSRRALSLTIRLTLAVLLLGFSKVAWAIPVPLVDIPTEFIATPMTGGLDSEYRWWSRYDIGFTQATGTFNIDLNIMLIGDDPGNPLKTIWEQGIEDIWSGQFQIVQDSQYFYDVVFDTQFVDDPSGMHHVVTVHEGTGSTNLGHWYTQNPSGWPQNKQDEMAAHEAGHLFGNYDEYLGGAVNPDGSFGNVPDSLMGSQLTQTLDPRHYHFITDWVSGKAPISEFVVAMASPPLPPAIVPEPSSLLLLGSGLAGIITLKRKFRK